MHDPVKLTSEDLIDAMMILSDARDHYGWLRKDASRRVAWDYYETIQARAQELIDTINEGISWGLSDERTLAELEGQRDVALDTIAAMKEAKK